MRITLCGNDNDNVVGDDNDENDVVMQLMDSF